jgi:hypothetical protein
MGRLFCGVSCRPGKAGEKKPGRLPYTEQGFYSSIQGGQARKVREFVARHITRALLQDKKIR